LSADAPAPDDDERLAEHLAETTVAVAESLTGGLLANRLARLPDASSWFHGGIVAYVRAVKEDVLDIGDAPVVSEASARSMAASVARLLGAEHSVAVTGVGGPDPQDGIPAGTVWIAVHGPHGSTAELQRFDGDPAEVCQQTCDRALELLSRAVGEEP
jgi:nicotinamide-nucleotide amidase